MFQYIKGFAQFISLERGLMIFTMSVGAAFLTRNVFAWPSALYLGIIAFSIWSAVDAINNICDVDLDVLSDPLRAQFTKKLGKIGLLIAICFTALSLALGAATMIPNVTFFVATGILFGVLYSVPPFRLRKTPYKPVINFTVGAVPVLIVAAFFDVFSFKILSLSVLLGVTTAVNSLWEDLADYHSDFTSGSRTLPIMFGFKKGLFMTILMGYAMIPLMILVGMLFQLGWLYYAALSSLVIFISFRLLQNRASLFKNEKADNTTLFKLGEVLAKDFVIVAIIFMSTLMLSSILRINPTL
jgi:4-hydroxybenzoate polyprenyltransferase